VGLNDIGILDTWWRWWGKK